MMDALNWLNHNRDVLWFVLTPLIFVQPLRPWVWHLLRLPRRRSVDLTPRARYSGAWKGLQTATTHSNTGGTELTFQPVPEDGGLFTMAVAPKSARTAHLGWRNAAGVSYVTTGTQEGGPGSWD
jgi:hypothetical protein